MQRKFSDCLDHEEMQQALETLPESLEDMYADVLTNQIPKKHRRKARSMLMWLAYSMRPLRLQELATVADLPNPMDVRRICTSSLVTFSQETLCSSKGSVGATWNEKPRRESDEDTIVKFDHFSVKEYLLSEDLQASSRHPVFYFYVPPLLAHLSIAEMSVSHLLKTNGSHFKEDDIYVERTSIEMEFDCEDGWVECPNTRKEVATEFWPEFPLLEYSTFWHNHVWEADAIEARLAPMDATKPNPSEFETDNQSILSQAETLRAQIHRLFSDAFSQSFENWVRLLNLFTRDMPYCHSVHYPQYSEVPSPMWMASFLNLPDIVRRLLQSEMESGRRIDFVRFWERQPDWERTPIQIATRYGHLKVLNLLLEADMHMEQSEFARLVPDLRQNISAVLNTLLEARPLLSITERIVENVQRSRAQADTYKLALNSPGRVNLTKAMLDFIVKTLRRNSDSFAIDLELVETIMGRAEDVGYNSGNIIETSAQDAECGRSLERVVDRSKPPSISQDVLALMAANDDCGEDMLAIVFDNYKDVQVSQNLLVSIFGNTYHGANMLAMLWEHGKDIRFSQDLLPLIVANRKSGTEMLTGVFKRCKSIPISQDLLIAACKHGSSDGGELLDLILGYDKNIEVSEDALRAIAKNVISGAAMVSAIFAHKKTIEFSEDTLNAIARNENKAAKIFSDILDHNIDIAFSEETLKAAASNYPVGIEIFWTILSHNKHIVVSTEVMGAIKQLGREMEGSWPMVGLDMHIMNLLMDHGNCEIKFRGHFESKEEMMSCQSGRKQHYEECKIRISREMRQAAMRWEPDAIEFLLAHKRPNVTFTKSPRQEISEDADS